MSGWGALGDVLGGGFNTDQAYESGRLRTAQTEVALESARNNQLKNMAQEFQAKNQAGLEDSLVAAGVDPVAAHMQATIANAGVGADYNAAMSGIQTGIENKALTTLGDPNAPLGNQFSAGQVAEHKFVPRLQNTGGAIMDVTQYQPGVAPTIYNTPEAESKIAENRAQAYATMHPELKPDAGPKPPSGYVDNTLYDPNLDPILHPEIPDTGDVRGKRWLPGSGGPEDASTPRRLDNRGIAQLNRAVNAAENTADDLDAMVQMPAGVSQGYFGAGGNPGDSLIKTTVDNLKLGVADQWDRFYIETLPGLSQQIRLMESYGLPGAVSTANQFDALANRKPDSVEDHLYKLATIKNSADNFLETAIATGGVPTAKLNQLKALIARFDQSIPFDRLDIIAMKKLQDSGSPLVTLEEVIQKRKLNTPVGRRPTLTGNPTGQPAGAAGTSPSGLKVFGSEEEARAAGFRNGDRVNIGGVDGTLN